MKVYSKKSVSPLLLKQVKKGYNPQNGNLIAMDKFLKARMPYVLNSTLYYVDKNRIKKAWKKEMGENPESSTLDGILEDNPPFLLMSFGMNQKGVVDPIFISTNFVKLSPQEKILGISYTQNARTKDDSQYSSKKELKEEILEELLEDDEFYLGF